MGCKTGTRVCATRYGIDECSVWQGGALHELELCAERGVGARLVVCFPVALGVPQGWVDLGMK